jgi:zinc transport system ATP-binding protein
MKESTAIMVRDVNFSYNGIPVLTDVNLIIQEGEFLSMVGPNGGGKTTLIRIMLGLLKPNTGEVRIFGKPPEKSRETIGYMPQHTHFDPQFPVRVSDVVLMGRLSPRRGLYTKKDKEKVSKSLGEVEMEDFHGASFSELSGGQRQRVLLARALVSNPKILLLDEPTANVDIEIEQKLYNILEDLNRRMTILMVTHDLGFVYKIVKRVICVKRQVLVHPTSELSGTLIQDMYGHEIQMVRHDHSSGKDGPSYGCFY